MQPYVTVVPRTAVLLQQSPSLPAVAFLHGWLPFNQL